ncbi:hypothetical protein [Nocardia salmonicida]|uniref:hypothetical protein n=1 Tax=Nocardia salmonicida TaxID=53431 RepID=UPI0007A4E0AC|nr:hypothetical protein [Nocardia salmonicida]
MTSTGPPDRTVSLAGLEIDPVLAARLRTRFAEALRALRPGGVFAGSDGLDNRLFRLQHLGDMCVPVPPDTLADRLASAGFTGIDVESGRAMFRFRAERPR